MDLRSPTYLFQVQVRWIVIKVSVEFSTFECYENEHPFILDLLGFCSYPSNSCSIQLQHNLKSDVSIKLSSIYLGNIHANNDKTVTIPKTIILSLEASKGFNLFKFTAGIQNLLNKQYSDNVRINAFGARFYEAAIPRQGFVRMRYQL